VTCPRVAFHATGRVLDDRRLHHIRETGVGTAKAYGCGLLLAIERTDT
jgi:hypothetical protein